MGYAQSAPPQFAQTMRRHYRSAVAHEDAFGIYSINKAHARPGLEIAHIPNVLANHEWFAPQNSKVAQDQFDLKFFTEHFGFDRMPTGERDRARLGQDERLINLAWSELRSSDSACAPASNWPGCVYPPWQRFRHITSRNSTILSSRRDCSRP